jgi:hypothetical protein
VDDETARMIDQLRQKVDALDAAMANHRHHRDPQWDEWLRMVDRNGRAVYADHFRSGVIPTGYTWDAAAPYNGAPGTVSYNYQGTYMYVAVSQGACLLHKHITDYSGHSLTARLTVGWTTEIGLRIDDGSDDNYVMIILDPDNAGAYNLDYRYRAGGGAVTDVPGPQHLCGEFVVPSLYYNAATPAFDGFIKGEHGAWLSVGSFNTGAIAWVPSRIGIVVQGNSGDLAFCDWFWTDMS